MCRKSKSELTAPKNRQENDDDVRIMLKQLLTEGSYTEEDLEKVYEVLRNYSVKQLQELYFALQKEFGAPLGMDIYRQLKPKIKSIYQKIPK